MVEVLRSLRYAGGKCLASGNTTGVGRWVATHLPYKRMYVEPFAGMASVFLSRRPSRREILNDLDGRINNWWRAVRDHPKELEARLEATPAWSVELFEEACSADYENLDCVSSAFYFTLRLAWGFGAKPDDETIGRSNSYRLSVENGHRPPRLNISGIAKRLRGVVLERQDAVVLLQRLHHLNDVVWYLDPPYEYSTKVHSATVDHSALIEVLSQVKGFVAVSGFRDQFDELGWWRTEHQSATSLPLHSREERTEVLWVNRPEHQAVEQRRLW